MADSVFDRMRQLGNNAAPDGSGGDDAFARMRERFGSSSGSDTLIPPPQNPVYSRSLQSGTTEGLQQMGDVVDPALSKMFEIFGVEPNTAQRAKRREEYENEFKNDPVAETGRIGAQVLATAPMSPVGTIGRAFASAPAAAILGTGLVNKLGMAMTTGGVSGAIYGGATGQDVAGNAAAGAVAGPVVSTAGKLGKMVIPGARSLIGNAEIISAARNAGVDKSAIKNVISILDNEGLSPAQAIAELNSLGQKGTIADLGPSATTEASGLAALSGKPTAILKGRFADRANEAGSEARRLIETRLGPRVDLEAEKQAIHDRAGILTSGDYNSAHASKTKLNVSNIAAHIDDELDAGAVGSEAAQLKAAKGYFYKPNGELKDDVRSLHKIRQQLDDTLSRLPKEGTSQGTATYRAVSTIRDLVDSKLKTIPEMASADAKFAEHMQVKNGLQIGYDALTKKTNKDEFIKAFNAASPEMQDTIRKGARNAIWDVMEGSTRGQEGGVTSLFNKKAINQELLRTIYGTHGDSIIDAVHNEVAQRGTEQAVRFGAQTAERQAVRQKYSDPANPNLNDFGLGLAADVYGGGGAGVGAALIKRGITNRIVNFTEGRRERLTEGTADLLSRQGPERDVGMQVIDQVDKIQKRLGMATRAEKIISPLRLPKTMSAPLGVEGYERAKEQLLGK